MIGTGTKYLGYGNNVPDILDSCITPYGELCLAFRCRIVSPCLHFNLIPTCVLT